MHRNQLAILQLRIGLAANVCCFSTVTVEKRSGAASTIGLTYKR